MQEIYAFFIGLYGVICMIHVLLLSEAEWLLNEKKKKAKIGRFEIAWYYYIFIFILPIVWIGVWVFYIQMQVDVRRRKNGYGRK